MADREDENSVEQYDEWKERYESGEDAARELFRQISHIAVCLSYDLIDKLRYWEKESMKLSDDEIGERLPHMAAFLEQLKAAYVDFADVDL